MKTYDTSILCLIRVQVKKLSLHEHETSKDE